MGSSSTVEAVLDRLRSFGTATLHEVMGRKNALDSSIRPLWWPVNMSGLAFTVACPPDDNLAVHRALAIAGSNDVLVVTMSGYSEAGFWGDVATTAAQARGIRGLVTDGGVRDSRSIREMRFPVFSRAVSIKGTTKDAYGLINEPIACGGIIIHPGDYVVGDDDGVVIVEASQAEQVIEAARQREEKEEVFRRELRDGKTTLELLGLRAVVERLERTEGR